MKRDGRNYTLRINKLRDNGMRLADALKSVGLSRKMYNIWMKRLADEAKTKAMPLETVIGSETALPFVSFDQ